VRFFIPAHYAVCQCMSMEIHVHQTNKFIRWERKAILGIRANLNTGNPSRTNLPRAWIGLARSNARGGKETTGGVNANEYGCKKFWGIWNFSAIEERARDYVSAALKY